LIQLASHHHPKPADCRHNAMGRAILRNTAPYGVKHQQVNQPDAGDKQDGKR
jgi:hypothetical protein